MKGRRALVACGLLLLAGWLLDPHNAQAQNCVYHAEGERGDWVECPPDGGGGGGPAPSNAWGAIYISPSTLQNGASWDYATRAAAEREAWEQCRIEGATDCKQVMWVENRCMALATSDPENAYGTSRAQARREAMAECRSGGGRSCTLVVDRCM